MTGQSFYFHLTSAAMGLAATLVAACEPQEGQQISGTPLTDAVSGQRLGALAQQPGAILTPAGDLVLPWTASPEKTATPQMIEGRACVEALRAKTNGWSNMTDEDFKSYVTCSAAAGGSIPADPAAKFDAWLLAANQKITGSGKQLVATTSQGLRDWAIEQLGRIEFEVDSRTGHLGKAEGTLSAALSPNIKAAKSELAGDVTLRLTAACEMTGNSNWVEKSSSRMRDEGPYQVRYERRGCGLRFEDDQLEISVGPDGHNPNQWRAKSAWVRCYERVPADFSCVPSVGLSTATSLGVQAFLPNEAATAIKTELLIIRHANEYHLAWLIIVDKVSDSHRVYVDAHSGQVLRDNTTIAHGTHSGTLSFQARLPYSTATSTQAMTFAKMYENDTQSGLLGETSSTGTYTNLSHANQSDETWEPYFIGTYVSDNAATDISGFAATGGTTYSAFATFPQRIAEAFYALNYVRSLAASAWNGVPAYTPIPLVVQNNANACNGSCCAGVAGTLTLDGWCGNPSGSGAGRSEQLYRWMQYHEFGHSPLRKAGSLPNCSLCSAWDEGNGDILAYTATRLEQLRLNDVGLGCGEDNSGSSGTDEEDDDFRPNDTYDDDACAEQHDTANIFAGAYLELYYELGWRDALARNLEIQDGEVDSNTAWTDSTNSNSFYEHMLQADKDFWDIGAWQFSIGQAWKRHDDTATYANWEWKDQLPGAANPAYMFRPTTTGSWETITSGPDAGLPRLAFDFDKDRDYIWIYTYDDENYIVRTWNLCSNVNPKMHWVRMVSGAESLTTSTDCADPGYGNNPCVNVVSGLNGWAGIRVEQEVAGQGLGCYDIEIQRGDDCGDAAGASRAIANDNTWYTGTWEGAGDADFYKVYVKEAGSGKTLDVETCEITAGSNPDTVISVYYQDDLVNSVASDDDNAGACGTATPRRSSKLSYSLPTGKTGWYYVKVNEYNNDAAGSYKIRALQNGGDRDLGGSALGSAYTVTDNELTGRYVAGDLSSADDNDWFKVSLTAQEHVTFHTGEGTLDTVIEIYDDGTTGYSALDVLAEDTGSDLKWMRRDDDGAFESLKSQLHFAAPRTGDYYIKIRPYTENSVGTYTLFVQRMGNSATAYPSFP